MVHETRRDYIHPCPLFGVWFTRQRFLPAGGLVHETTFSTGGWSGSRDNVFYRRVVWFTRLGGIVSIKTMRSVTVIVSRASRYFFFCGGGGGRAPPPQKKNNGWPARL